jgi:hypothetical protein
MHSITESHRDPALEPSILDGRSADVRWLNLTVVTTGSACTSGSIALRGGPRGFATLSGSRRRTRNPHAENRSAA